MAGDKYLKVNSTGDAEEQAAIQTSAGAGDAGKIIAADAGGLIDASFLPSSGLREMLASETLSAGDMINVFDDSGTVKIRKADCSNGRRAHGYVPEGITSGEEGPVNLGNGVNDDKSSLTEGVEYFLSTSGGITTTPPTTATHLLQSVGVSLSETELQVILAKPIKRA